MQHFFVFKWLIVFLSNLWLCQPLQVTFGSYQAFRKAAAMPATATEHPILWSEQYRRFYDSKKKLTLKTYFFCEVKQLYLVQVFDFETVPALPRSSGPPRPSGKRRQRRQPRTYIKLSGQTSTKDLRSILLLHEFDSKKIFTIIKIIGRPLNLLFLTFDFFSLRASKCFLFSPGQPIAWFSVRQRRWLYQKRRRSNNAPFPINLSSFVSAILPSSHHYLFSQKMAPKNDS